MVKPLIRERRNWIRADRVLSLEYRLSKSRRKDADRSWHLSTTQEISLGGLSFYGDEEYRPGDVLEIRVVMSGILDVFRGFAEVVRVERKKMAASHFVAVKFISAQKQDRVRAGSLCGRHSRMRGVRRI